MVWVFMIGFPGLIMQILLAEAVRDYSEWWFDKPEGDEL